jgi:nitrite reductase/ring-hydroxylating ferredoxin subunit
MKFFVIIINFSAEAGHSIVIVRAYDEAQALEKYCEHQHWDCSKKNCPGLQITELTDDVTEVYRYDNPNYEG